MGTCRRRGSRQKFLSRFRVVDLNWGLPVPREPKSERQCIGW